MAYTVNPWTGQHENVVDARPQRGGPMMRVPPESHQRAMQADKLARLVESVQMQSAAGGGYGGPPQGGGRGSGRGGGGGGIEERLVELVAGGAIDRSRMREEHGLREQSAIGASTRKMDAAAKLAELEQEYASQSASEKFMSDVSREDQRHAHSEMTAAAAHDRGKDERMARIAASSAAGRFSDAQAKAVQTPEQAHGQRMDELEFEKTGRRPNPDGSPLGPATQLPYEDRRVLAQQHLANGGSQEDALAIQNGEMNPSDTTLFQSTSPERAALLEEMAKKMDDSTWFKSKGTRPWEEASFVEGFRGEGMSRNGYFSFDESVGPGSDDQAFERAQMLIASDPRYKLYGITVEDVVRAYREED